MSAESCVVFYGVRFEVREDETEPLEARSDRRLISARNKGLSHYWANFGAPGDKYFLFIGNKVAIVGAENASEASLSGEALGRMMEETTAKLKEAGFTDKPCLWVQWHPDA